MKIRFEPMKETHIDDIFGIMKESFLTGAWTKKMFESELSNPISFFVTGIDEESGAIVCYGGMWLIGDIAEITNIAVAPEFRGRGFGKETLNFLEGICRKKNISQINLEVRADNTVALELYESFGFVPVGRRKNYYGGRWDAILMSKNLQR